MAGTTEAFWFVSRHEFTRAAERDPKDRALAPVNSAPSGAKAQGLERLFGTTKGRALTPIAASIQT